MSRTVKEADLGEGPSGTTLAFTVPDAHGFSADATLDLEFTRVAAWQSIEIAGMTTAEDLIPTGLYTLQVVVAFRSRAVTRVTLEFESLLGDERLNDAELTFSGKDGDIGRAVVFLNIA